MSGELDSFGGFICRSIDRIVEDLDGLGEAGAHWRPPAPDANSLVGLALHTMSNAEENLLATLCRLGPVERSRAAEFENESATVETVRARWAELRPRIEAALRDLDPAELDREREHPRRGPLTGRDVLIVVARHAAEHQGQADLTRDLYLARATR